MKYNHVRLIAKSTDDGSETDLLHPHEPFFLVRGTDPLAGPLVAVYKALGDTAGADTTGLDDLAERVQEFQAANPGLVKLAD